MRTNRLNEMFEILKKGYYMQADKDDSAFLKVRDHATGVLVLIAWGATADEFAAGLDPLGGHVPEPKN